MRSIALLPENHANSVLTIQPTFQTLSARRISMATFALGLLLMAFIGIGIGD
jgi:hypothetical protein